jgi:hypothetical protein
MMESTSHGINLEHDPEKWKPVFRKDHAQTKDGVRAWVNFVESGSGVDCAAARRLHGHFGGCPSPKNRKQQRLEARHFETGPEITA